MITIALYHIKGGVGKTSAAVNLAHLSALGGHQTLLCDLDPQGSVSFYFRITTPANHNVGRLISGGEKLAKMVRETDYPGLYVLPSNLSFRKLDLELHRVKHAKRRLKDTLNPFGTQYDLLFLDCPPGITLEAEAVFRAADYVLVPTIPTYLSMRTRDQIFDFFSKRDLPLDKLLSFFSMVDLRKKLHTEIVEQILLSDDGFLKTYIPFASSVEKMGEYRMPLTAMSRKSSARSAFVGLWEELKMHIYAT